MKKLMLIKASGYCLSVMLCLFIAVSHADEIRFRNPGSTQIGTVVEEDPDSITIRFSKDSIQFIRRDEQAISNPPPPPITWEQQDDQLVVKIPLRYIQPGSETTSQAKSTGQSSQSLMTLPKPETSVSVVDPAKESEVQEAMLMEELGEVQGTIVWQERPLQTAMVMIVLERYTGFSIQAVKKKFLKNGNQAISFETRTDSEGRYAFKGVPPGDYRLYWLPDEKTGWMRRLREEPDLEVISGRLTQLNIPARRK